MVGCSPGKLKATCECRRATNRSAWPPQSAAGARSVRPRSRAVQRRSQPGRTELRGVPHRARRWWRDRRRGRAAPPVRPGRTARSTPSDRPRPGTASGPGRARPAEPTVPGSSRPQSADQRVAPRGRRIPARAGDRPHVAPVLPARSWLVMRAPPGGRGFDHHHDLGQRGRMIRLRTGKRSARAGRRTLARRRPRRTRCNSVVERPVPPADT